MRLEYFQLIDRIVEIDLNDRTIRTEATVPLKSTIFEGHFPGFPLMPGVLLTEAMAQTSGWLIVGFHKFGRMPFLSAVKEAKFRGFVQPGDVLSLTATLDHDGSGYAIASAQAERNGKRVCNATLQFSVTEFPNPQFREHMTAMAKTLEFPMKVLDHA